MPRTRKREAKNVIAALHALNWAIRPEALRQLLEISKRENIVTEALEAKLGQPVNDEELMTVRDGIATIPVSGPLFRYANLFTQISGATAYATLATDLQLALEMPQVRSIILSIDSPGGEVNGCAEFADLVFAARGRKPIVAYISGDGCSAAYWIASAADEIVVAQTSIVGCIGTVATLVDDSAADEMMGIRQIEIVSSQTPKKRLPALSGEAQAQVQTMVDDLAQVFIESIAKFRGVGPDVVLSNYGEGGVFVGDAAVSQGLADRLGSYEELHAELAYGGYTTPSRPTQAPAIPINDVNTNGEETGMQVKPAIAAAASTQASDTAPAADTGTVCTCGHDQSQHDANTGPCTVTGCDCQAYTADVPAAAPDPAGAAAPAVPPAPAQPASVPDATGAESVALAAATAERERIAGIEALGRPGEEQLVAECQADPRCTVADAALRLRRADTSIGRKRLQSLAADETQLEAPGPNGPVSSDVSSASGEARRIIAAYTKITTPNRS
jgi:capsid assembly protease